MTVVEYSTCGTELMIIGKDIDTNYNYYCVDCAKQRRKDMYGNG